MRILIVSFGSIGRRHYKNIRQLYPDVPITIWHLSSRKSHCDELFDDFTTNVYSFEDAIKNEPDAAIITCPAPFHIPVAIQLAKCGIHLFIEKPLSHNFDRIDEFQNLSRDLKIMVGYNLRFLPSLRVMKQTLLEGKIGKPLYIRAEVGQYLPDWRPGQDYRQSVSAQKKLGGGAILELSHELDYAIWLMGEVNSVTAHVDHLSDLEMDVEDSADITLCFENGAIGNIHLDMIQRPTTRGCKIIGTNGSLIWDGINNSLKLYSVTSKNWEDLGSVQPYDNNQMYIDEITHFINCIKENKTPLITLEDGINVLKLAISARESSIKQKCVKL